MELDWGFDPLPDAPFERGRNRYQALKKGMTLDGLIDCLQALRAEHGGHLRVIDSFDQPVQALVPVYFDGKQFYLAGEARPRAATLVGIMIADES